MKPEYENRSCNRLPGNGRCTKLIANGRCSQKNNLTPSRQCVNGDCKDLAAKIQEN